MTTLVGHDEARRQLAVAPAGQALLLAGPSGVGKHLVALATAHHHVAAVDVVTFRPVRMDDVRELLGWLRTSSLGGRGKAAVLDLDGSVPAVAQALLKIVEEPPADAWLLLSASGAVPATLASRVRTIRMGPLSDIQTEAVLAGSGVMGDDLWRLVRLAGGRPGYALQFREALGGRARVLTLVTAMARKDWSLTTKVLRGHWDQAAIGAFQLWVADVLNGTTRAYAPGEQQGLAKLVPRERLVAAERMLALPVPPSLAVSMATRKILG